MTFIKHSSIVPPISTFQRLLWQTLSNAFLESMKLWYRLRWCSRCFAIMTLQTKICSTVLGLAPKLASPCLGGWSILWSCSPRLSEASLLWWGYSLVIWSTPLATSSVPRCSDIKLIVLSLFLPTHYLSVQRGCHPLHATCLFSLLVLHPLQYRRTVLSFRWFVLWSRRRCNMYIKLILKSR